MSKRKNTLNDLEEFLKLQATILVAPQPVEVAPEKVVAPSAPVEEIQREEIYRAPVATPAQPIDLLTEMKKMAGRNKTAFYDFIIQTAESLPNSANDILLINTALYLKHGANWKEGIEEYWRGRNVIR